MTSPDDKTVIVPQSSAQDARSGEASPHALATGTRVAEFEIVALIGEGGFGIVYLALDTQLDRNVALKEYIPASLACRASAARVTVRSERHEDTFRAGLKSFVNEARLLAHFDHHSLVKVYRFWEANGTAYMVMPYYEGATLRETLRAMQDPPDEAWLRALLAPLLDALDVLHREHCYHRDIAPDNVLLLKETGRPLLLDFGAARRVIGDMTQALTVILKPGYAPVEQYAEVAALRQGPWTDLYALAASVYFAITRTTPPISVGRLVNDTYEPLAKIGAGRYSPRFLQAIDHALAVRPEERPQSVAAFAAELDMTPGDAQHASANEDVLRSVQTTRGSNSAGSTATGPPRVPATVADAHGAGTQSTHGTRAGHGKGRRAATIVAVLLGVLGLTGLAAWFAMRPAATPEVTAVATPVAPARPARTQEATAGPSPADAPAASAPAAAAPLPPVVAALPAYTPGGELERIVGLADPSIRVTASTRDTAARIDKDYLQFRLTANRAGYVYVFMVDPAGEYSMIFPNGIDRKNALAANQTLALPRATWPMLAAGPAGPNRFLVLVSPVPRDFSDGGLRAAAVFSDFPKDAQRSAAMRRTATYSPFAGKPVCGAGAQACTDTFGAAAFTIDVVNGST